MVRRKTARRDPDKEILLARGGIITERNADFCIVRLRLPAGVVAPERLGRIVAIAKRYGVEEVHLTTRQTIELPHVDPARLKKLVAALERNGTPLGAERDEIVNVTACPGTRHCKYATVDSVALARAIDEKFFGKEMPVKVRIAVSACPNSCVSERLNEIGVTGIQTPVRDPGLCTGCGTCTNYCRENAITIRRGVIVLDPEKCVECGSCIQSCPFHILKGREPRYRITVGGRRGRHPKVGRYLVTVNSPEEVIRVIGEIVTWIYRRAYSNLLLSEQLDDLKFDEFRKGIEASVAVIPPGDSPVKKAE